MHSSLGSPSNTNAFVATAGCSAPRLATRTGSVDPHALLRRRPIAKPHARHDRAGLGHAEDIRQRIASHHPGTLTDKMRDYQRTRSIANLVWKACEGARDARACAATVAGPKPVHMKVFITRGTGWIGSGILRELRAAAHEVTALVQPARAPTRSPAPSGAEDRGHPRSRWAAGRGGSVGRRDPLRVRSSLHGLRPRRRDPRARDAQPSLRARLAGGTNRPARDCSAPRWSRCIVVAAQGARDDGPDRGSRRPARRRRDGRPRHQRVRRHSHRELATLEAAHLGVRSASDRARPPVLVLAARLGLLVLILGSIEGFVMVHNGGHTVGARDGGAGLPFVGWSGMHGDLRVAHFAAIHALQVFLGAGFVLSRARVPQPSLIMIGVAVSYTGLCVWLFRGATLGHPITAARQRQRGLAFVKSRAISTNSRNAADGFLRPA